MAEINGVVVPGTLVPTGTTDTYPVTDPCYAIDGHRSVANSAERDAIPAERRRQGMTVAVQADYGDGPNRIWQLKALPWNFDDTDWIELFTKGVEEAPTDGQVYGRSNASWVPVTAGTPDTPGVNAASYNTENWNYTSGADASGNGTVGISAGGKKIAKQWKSATTLNINHMSTDGRDMALALDVLFATGNDVIIQVKSDATIHGRYRITGPAINNGNWRQYPITLVASSGTSPADATPMTVTAVQYIGGVGGSTNLTEGFGIDITGDQVSIDNNYPGQASITTVGNVTSGTISGGTWT